MKDQLSFIEQCLGGDAGLDDIDDFIDVWHEGGTELELWEFLGMTRDEYGLWVENAETLPAIVSAHRFGTTVNESAHELALAARGVRAEEMHRVEEWLRRRTATST